VRCTREDVGEALMTHFTILSRHYTGQNKLLKNLSHDNRYPNRDPKLVPTFHIIVATLGIFLDYLTTLHLFETLFNVE